MYFLIFLCCQTEPKHLDQVQILPLVEAQGLMKVKAMRIQSISRLITDCASMMIDDQCASIAKGFQLVFALGLV